MFAINYSTGNRLLLEYPDGRDVSAEYDITRTPDNAYEVTHEQSDIVRRFSLDGLLSQTVTYHRATPDGPRIGREVVDHETGFYARYEGDGDAPVESRTPLQNVGNEHITLIAVTNQERHQIGVQDINGRDVTDDYSITFGPDRTFEVTDEGTYKLSYHDERGTLLHYGKQLVHGADGQIIGTELIDAATRIITRKTSDGRTVTGIPVEESDLQPDGRYVLDEPGRPTLASG